MWTRANCVVMKEQQLNAITVSQKVLQEAHMTATRTLLHHGNKQTPAECVANIVDDLPSPP